MGRWSGTWPCSSSAAGAPCHSGAGLQHPELPWEGLAWGLHSCQHDFTISRIAMMRIIFSWLLGGWNCRALRATQPCPWRAAGQVQSVQITSASFPWLHNRSSLLPAPVSEDDLADGDAAWLSLSTKEQPHRVPLVPKTSTHA